jgi:hypothetical protein
MTTLIEKSILNERLEKSRSGTYSDTSENRRKHRVGQKYGSEKKEEEKPEKTSSNEKDPEKELEAINMVIAAVNEGKLKLPQEEIMVLVEKKTMAEEAVKQAKGEKKPEKKEEPKKEATKPESKSGGKQYASMDIKEAKKELVGKKITFKEYFFDGIDSYKDAEGEIKRVRLYGKDKTPIAEIDFPNGDSVTVSLDQLDKRQAAQFKIEFNDSKPEDSKPESKKEDSEGKDELKTAQEELQRIKDKKDFWVAKYGKNSYDTRLQQAKDEVERLKNKKRSEKEKKSDEKSAKKAEEMKERIKGSEKSEAEKEDLRAAREKLGYLQDNEERLIKRDGKEKYEERLKQAKDDVAKLKGEKPKEETEESYTRVKFEDIPNSGKVNLKKYLSEKVRKGVDEKWSNIKNIPTDNLKKMEKGLVNDLNKNFEAIKKSQRAELLYSIMKVKGELEKRGKESQKKE